MRRRRLNLVELLLREQHVLILFVLVALHNFRAFHVSVARRAHQRLLQPRIAHFVQLVEADPFAARGREQPYRYGNQTEREVAFPNTCGHGETPSGNVSPVAQALLPVRT